MTLSVAYTIMNYKLGGRKWFYLGINLEGLKKTTKILVGIATVPAEFRTGCLSNTLLKHYLLPQFSRCVLTSTIVRSQLTL
jgi:hypothetical protein